MVQRIGFSAAQTQFRYLRENADRIFICATAPASFSAAANQPSMIVSAVGSADDWTQSSGASGPVITFAERTVTVDGSGSATHVAFCRASGSTVLMVTDCCGATIMSSGQNITIPGFRMEFNAGDIFNATRPQAGHTIAAPEMFSPTALPDLQAWFAPDSIATVSAGRIVQWNDKTANTYHASQASADRQPTHTSAGRNGFNVATFNGTTTILVNAGLLGFEVQGTTESNPFTIAFAGVVASATGSAATFWGAANSGGTTGTEFSVSAGSYFFKRRGAGDPASISDALVAPDTNWHVHRLTLGADHRYTYVLDGVVVTADGIMSAATPVSGNRFSLGARLSSDLPNLHLDGAIAELIVCSTVLSSSHGRELDKLLGAKYAITIT